MEVYKDYLTSSDEVELSTVYTLTNWWRTDNLLKYFCVTAVKGTHVISDNVEE